MAKTILVIDDSASLRQVVASPCAGRATTSSKPATAVTRWPS